jgi:O-antigen/teichoic acid export membrane protein
MTRADLTVELIAEVPDHQRRRILSGMRWTVWLAALAFPFSYATTALLARVSPEAIGTYGLLTVYIGVVTAFLYLGGDAVVIRFIPTLQAADRLSFLGSYLLLICLVALPWLAIAWVCRDKLHFLFGRQAAPSFYLLILCLSPICIAFSLVMAALKGMLEIAWAQALIRLLTVGSSLLYVALFIGARSFLRTHYTGVIWGLYLALAAVAASIGLWRLVRSNQWARFNRLRFILPRGFWRYALATQQLGIVLFLIQRTDYILVLNFGGLETLGKYVAVSALALIIPVVSTVFLDSLLPSLTNLVAAENYKGASEVFAMHMRILFIVGVAGTTGLMVLAGPLTVLLGPKYDSLRVPLVVMVLLLGLTMPGTFGGTLLASVGKQQRAVWVGLGQLGLFICLFVSLWTRWQLMGAVLAYGLSMFLSNVVLLIVAKLSVPISFSVAADYAKFIVIAALSAAVAHKPLSLAVGLLIWAAAVLVFLIAAGYRVAECTALLYCFAPRRPCSSTGTNAQHA